MSSLYSTTYHLKSHKRDHFIEFIKSLLLTPFILSTKPSSNRVGSNGYNLKRYLEILKCLEELIEDSILWSDQQQPNQARLKTLCPSIGTFFTPLPLVDAFKELDMERSFAGRRFVPPSFNDIRHLLNRAQIKAVAPNLELITFDGDMTLYADGADFARDSRLVELLGTLLRLGKKVAIVTAAGYPKDCKRYEQRLSGLLESFREEREECAIPAEYLSNFYVLGGECNYLFQYDPKINHLVYIEPEKYQPEFMVGLEETEIQDFLNHAESHLEARISEMQLCAKVSIVRKNRAVGVNPRPSHSLQREQLDELALSVQDSLRRFQMRRSGDGSVSIPFCAFNGGSDVWVDIGNKLIGVKVLTGFFKLLPRQTLHVGDQFLATGNDIATRSACCTIWITSPQETAQCLDTLKKLLIPSSATKRRVANEEKSDAPSKSVKK